MTKMKALECIRDWGMWPRSDAQELDGTNLARIKEAMRAGQKLPPIVVDKKSLRVVDGFHRLEATIKLYGDNADIEVEFRTYKNDGEMFADAVELNAKSSLPLSPRDKIHCILKGRKLKIPPTVICNALGITDSKYHDFLEKRVATTKSGEKRPIPYGAIQLSDYNRAKRNKSGVAKPLTLKEEKAINSQNGVVPVIYMRLLLDMLGTDAFPNSDNEWDLISQIGDKIFAKLDKRRVSA